MSMYAIWNRGIKDWYYCETTVTGELGGTMLVRFLPTFDTKKEADAFFEFVKEQQKLKATQAYMSRYLVVVDCSVKYGPYSLTGAKTKGVKRMPYKRIAGGRKAKI